MIIKMIKELVRKLDEQSEKWEVFNKELGTSLVAQ